MQDAKEKEKKNRSRWLYGRVDQADKLTEVLAELLQDEPDYDSIVANLAGCSMCSFNDGSNSIDDNGSDLGDNVKFEF